MKKLLVLMVLCCFLAGLTASAQKKATIVFVSTEHNYGTIKEEEGRKPCLFEFTNKGNDTLKILNVRASCGCTSTDWTRTPVAPGGKGQVSITFDPRNRPGDFAKGVEVISNDPDNPNITLVVKGQVEPRPRTIADDFPNAIGNLRFSTGQLVFQNLPNTDKKTDTIFTFNEWDKPMTLDFANIPNFIKCQAIPSTLKPQEKGIIIVNYDASLRNEFGFIYDRVNINTNDSIQPLKQIAISANIIEDFSKLTPEQLANAPKISFETPTYDFGTVMEGTTVNWDYVFTNTGKDDLVIRKVKGG